MIPLPLRRDSARSSTLYIFEPAAPITCLTTWQSLVLCCLDAFRVLQISLTDCPSYSFRETSRPVTGQRPSLIYALDETNLCTLEVHTNAGVIDDFWNLERKGTDRHIWAEMPGSNFPTSHSSRHRDHHAQKPLIEYCTNEWQKCERYPELESDGNDFQDRLDRFLDRSLTLIRAPKFRRFFVLIILLAVSIIVLWVKIVAPFVEEERAAWASLQMSSNPAAGNVFGSNVRPQFPAMIQLKTLDPELLPRSSKNRNDGLDHKKRLIFVGDIHGCRRELEALLKKVHFDPSTDHLIALGDIVSKGPDSPGVIDLLRRYGASCVRGNHEDKLLLIVDDLQSNSLRSARNSKGVSDLIDKSPAKSDDPVRQLAASLTAEQIEYLKSCPVILRLGQVDAFDSEAVAVHAGLVPGLALEDQDPASVMNMRILDTATRVPSKKHEQKGSMDWYKLWNKYQRLLPVQQGLVYLKSFGKSAFESRTTVVYGHDSKKGLQIKQYTKGLDTGCVKGGQLTALVVGENGKQEIFQVDGKDYRKRPPVQLDVEDALR